MNRLPKIPSLWMWVLIFSGIFVVTSSVMAQDGDLNETVQMDPAVVTQAQEPVSETELKEINEEVQKEKENAVDAPVQLESTVEEKTLEAASRGTTAPGNVSLDFKDADILNVLRVLSLKSGTNIVAGPEVQGTVTIRLQDVPWDKAMEVVLRTYGYVYERDVNIIRVTTKENLALEELMTETFVLNYTTATDVEASIKDILTERGRVKSVPKANTIIVSDAPTNMYKVAQVIKQLDQVTPQVYIDAKVIRTQLDKNENLGINWNIQGNIQGSSRPVTFPFTAQGANNKVNPLNNRWLQQFYPGVPGNIGDDTNSFPSGTSTGVTSTPGTISGNTYTFGTLNFQSLTAALGLLRSKTNTKIVSNPRIVVLNNQTAKVQVGSQIPIPSFERNETTGSFVVSGFTYRDIGVVLNVTPHINQSREILVDVKPEISSRGTDVSFASTGSTSGFQAPSFNTTVAQTQLLIRDGETIAIGGLMREAESEQSSQVPGLSKVPFLGKLFRNSIRASGEDSNQRTETLFFITITIVDTEGQPTLIQAVQSPTSVAGAAPAVVSVQKTPV